MHAKILIECSFTSEELFEIIYKYCRIAHKQIEISELICRFEKIDRVACEQVRINELICRFEEIDRVAHEQVRISELSVDLMRLTELLVSK